MFQIAMEKDAAVLTVIGEIDLPDAPALRHALSDEVVPLAMPFVVDLTRCTFMLSVAIGELIRALQERGKMFSLRVSPSGPVHRVLKIVGLIDAEDRLKADFS